MNRVRLVNDRYASSASLLRHGVEVLVVGDPSGARLNAATRRVLLAARDDGPGLWDDLVGAAKSLRWRLVAAPQPAALNVGLQEGADLVGREAKRLRGSVSNTGLLDELVSAAVAVCETDPPQSQALLRSIDEVGASECVVVAASSATRAGLLGWLRQLGVTVLTASELDSARPDVEQAYAVGAPRFFRSSLVTAPVTNALSFVMPAWFQDRSIPRSAISAYADGAIRIQPRIFTEGDLAEPEGSEAESEEVDDDFLPQPIWGSRTSSEREPMADEVAAHKVLLSGSLAMWLDDGERIRALDLRQPPGERVTYVEVGAVCAGTHLLLRSGETERPALYEAALALLGTRAAAVNTTQRNWKVKLQDRLSELGFRIVVRDLGRAGARTADRARAWTEPNLVRPHSDHDFEVLLEWLGVPIQPTFGHATMLRRALYQASADIREELEKAVSRADLTRLERDGHLTLDVETAGFRGILATRVLAISPFSEIVGRHDARIPFEDRGGQWLE